MICHREPCVKVKGSSGAVWCLFSSQWILSHLIVSTQSSQNWITVEFYLSVWITIASDRRTTPCQSFCFPAHLHFAFWLHLGANMAASHNISVLSHSRKKKKEKAFSEPFYDSFAFLTLRFSFHIAVSTFRSQKFLSLCYCSLFEPHFYRKSSELCCIQVYLLHLTPSPMKAHLKCKV